MLLGKNIGGFHVVAEIIRELKSHMIPYKLKCSHLGIYDRVTITENVYYSIRWNRLYVWLQLRYEVNMYLEIIYLLSLQMFKWDHLAK